MTWLLMVIVSFAVIGCKRTGAVPEIPLAGIDPIVANEISNTVVEVKASPDSGAAQGKLGMVLKAAGFQSDATNCFARAETLDPKNPRWPYFQGTVDSLKRALAISPDQTFIRLRLAQLLMESLGMPFGNSVMLSYTASVGFLSLASVRGCTLLQGL